MRLADPAPYRREFYRAKLGPCLAYRARVAECEVICIAGPYLGLQNKEVSIGYGEITITETGLTRFAEVVLRERSSW